MEYATIKQHTGTSESSGYGTYYENTPPTSPKPEKKKKLQKKGQSSSPKIEYLALIGEKRYIKTGDKLDEISKKFNSKKLHVKELDLTRMTPKQATSQYEWIKESEVTCYSLFAQDVPCDFLRDTISRLKPTKLEIRGRSQSNHILTNDFLKHEFIKKIDEIKIMADERLELNFFETRKEGGQTIWLDMNATASAEELDQFKERAKAMKFDLISLNFRQSNTRCTLQKKIEQSKRDSSFGSPKTKKQKSKK